MVSCPNRFNSDDYEGSTVLVTGGLGFIGSALVAALSAVSCRIILLVRPERTAIQHDGQAAQVVTMHGDLGSRDTWDAALEGVDHVFHLAAQTSAYAANNDPMADLNANLVPVLLMLESCRQKGRKPAVLFSGTVTQVGLPTRSPVNESFRDHPIIMYDIHKLTAEKYLQFYVREAGIPTVTLRLANVYGPGTKVGSNDRGVLNRMIRDGREGKTLNVYGDGERIRDYVYIEDVVRAFLIAGNKARDLSGNYYIIGSGTGYQIVDAFNLVAQRVEQRLGERPLISHISPPEDLLYIEERNFIADTGRFTSATGWVPQVSLTDGIDRTLEYILRSEKVSPGAGQ